MTKPQYSGPWQKIRRQILERDGGLCQIQLDGCTTTATQVDHITPVSHGGQWWEPTNLRAACAHCNNKRPDNRHKDKWRTHKTRIILVQGPPCSGKTTWVGDTKGTRDLIIDYDAIQRALGYDGGHNGDHLHEPTMTARNALLRALRDAKYNIGRAWIISANPQASTMFPYHKLITINPGKETCYERAKAQGRPKTTFDFIDQWFDVGTGGIGDTGDTGDKSVMIISSKAKSRSW